jgi:integrase
MHAVITQAFLAKLKPGDYTVFDKRERGLALRVLPSGVMTWRVRLKTEKPQKNAEGKTEWAWYWWKLGGVDALKTPEAAREQAQFAKGQMADRNDPREAKRQQARDAQRQTTLKTFLDEQYAPWVRANRKRGHETVTTLENRCADFLETPLAGISPFAVERWRSAYLRRGKKPATVNRVLVALKACLSRAVEWHLLDRHPLAGLKLASVDPVGRLRYLTPDEEYRLLAALAARDHDRRQARASANDWRRERGHAPWPAYGAYTDHLTPMVITLLHTGLRFGEACGLTWGDVDLAGKLLTVRGETAKTARTRYLPLNTTALDALKAWKPEHVAADTYVFPGKLKGKSLTDIKTAWKELLRRVEGAPIVGFRVHDLRHTFASKLVQAGVDLNTVRELLGHQDIKMTLRYSHLAPEHRAAAVAKLVQAG